MEKVMQPVELSALKKVTVKGVAASKYHSAAFTSEGALYTWGTNYGALGMLCLATRMITTFLTTKIISHL